MVQNRHREDALLQPRALRLVPPPLDELPGRPPPLPPEALLPEAQLPEPRPPAPPIAVPESAFGDWSTDSGLSPEVQSQLSRWRRIRQGPWVRRRVFTGDNALPVAPRPRHPVVAPPAPLPPPASVSPASLARISASAPIELTTEIQAFDLDDDDDACSFARPVRRAPPSAGAIAFGAFFVAAATAIVWAIVHLA